MSGGYFDYDQFRIKELKEDIEDFLIRKNESTDINEFGEYEGNFFSPEIIEKFKEATKVLNIAYSMVHRIDWLVCADDSERIFHERWPKWEDYYE